jgi:hypothetical protein
MPCVIDDRRPDVAACVDTFWRDRLERSSERLKHRMTATLKATAPRGQQETPMNSPGIDWPAFDIGAFVAMHKRQRLEWERRQQLLTSAASDVDPADTIQPFDAKRAVQPEEP